MDGHAELILDGTIAKWSPTAKDMKTDKTLATETAVARGFSSVREWMKSNRKEASKLSTKARISAKQKARCLPLVDALDREFERFNHLV